MKTVKEKKREKAGNIIGDILAKIIAMVMILIFTSAFLWCLAVPILTLFADTEYQVTERNIYAIWQSKHYEEHNVGKTTSTSEVNRYFYKVKSGDSYVDNSTSYNISKIYIIEKEKQETIKIERLRYKNNIIDKIWDTPMPIKGEQVIAKYYIHKESARELGINIK